MRQLTDHVMAVEEIQPRPMIPIAIPAKAALPEPSSTDDSDRCEDCNRPLELCDCPL